MKRRRFFRGVGWFFFILLVILTYLLIYFFPTIIDINRSKREIKDINMRIQDLGRLEGTIRFSNKREKNFFRKLNKDWQDKIPKILNKSDRVLFIQRISEHIKEIVTRERIKNLIITTGGDIPEVVYQNIYPGISGQNCLRDQLKLFLESSKKNQSIDSEDSGYFAHLLENISALTLYTALEGDIKGCARFIRVLPLFSHYIKADKVLIKAGINFPYILVKLKVYFREKVGKNAVTKYGRTDNVHIDFNSPLLLQPVYFNFPEPGVRNELPRLWGRSDFVKSMEGE
jgi:hypothetical protein